MPYQHIPVMADIVVEIMHPEDKNTIVDCTLGGGGHAQALKKANKKLNIIGFDQDQEALAAAQENLKGYSDITYINDNFANLKKHLRQPVGGILFDLGVSSYQLDEPARGFSFRSPGPLDMRLGQQQPLTAGDIINQYPEEELSEIIFKYGEERFARRLSRAIVQARKRSPITTTEQLKAIIEPAIPTWKKRESLTRVFQALRIAVNGELTALELALPAALELLQPGGRIVVLSYHSLEDRIVKNLFRQAASDGKLKILTKKPLISQDDNPRARSAKLRAAEKI
ncbi:16S rRNA (cytosine(1402)-N(4))-methyltransferase [candidate division WOR-1 bacterium RIFOXYB2_FULL_48_7]|uniref:Ribosomal RNA small subunit methyltransferase H n=1 Tax=candidate division WOR-1 bacterium RIFOXYB2_FULL_48_7 TaxID=1802583 RepID=A0A1F4TS71_UNCSA|nr:MAG: 16S rRNA (cytosine(1402)-N(4))-methyltransferase [candidate division WOR-1 bacterium RIFOXYB2_FULL_48_7]